jgi:hypothetical protein
MFWIKARAAAAHAGLSFQSGEEVGVVAKGKGLGQRFDCPGAQEKSTAQGHQCVFLAWRGQAGGGKKGEQTALLGDTAAWLARGPCFFVVENIK